MINSKPKKLNITTDKNFEVYFKDMLLTIFDAQIKNYSLKFKNGEIFEINTYVENIKNAR